VLLPPERPRRLVYLGSPELAVPPLRALVGAGYEVAHVVSRADTRRGRGSQTTPSPVKAAALELGLPVSAAVDDVLDVHADLGVVVAFGRLIKPPVLERLALVNLHFSLLPRWRGAAPVERAILAGDRRTGVCLMALEETLDTGGVFRRAEVDIGDEETLEELRARLVALGTDLLLDALANGFGPPAPQEGTPTQAPRIDPAELHLDWSRPAAELHRVVRLGRAWTTFRGRRLLVWSARLDARGGADGSPGAAADGAGGAAPGTLDEERVATGDGWLTLVEVQPEGRGRQDAAAWRHGARPEPGERLGS
jgi:methionyl-tRNA formyltransferase